MKKVVINRNGIDELVEYPNEEVKEKFLKTEHEDKHVCKNNFVRILNDFFPDGKESIQVVLDCFCNRDKFETVAMFEDNSLITAKDNFKGWLNSVFAYLIQNDYQIIDERKYNHES